MTRIYDIKCTCGCLFSSYGDYCIPCFDDDNCTADWEYYKKENRVYWMVFDGFERLELELINHTKHQKEELALCIKYQFGVSEI